MDNPLDISAQIEALLFFKGEPVSVEFLARTLNASEDTVRGGILSLERSLPGRGVTLVRNGNEVELRTSPEMGKTLEKLIKDELNKDLGKAGLETLAIVLYRGPITRSEVNYIRGVNSNHILRSLLVRGLIEKVEEKEGEGASRSTIYRPTFDLLSYMGVSSAKDLPEYESIQKSVEIFKEEDKKQEEPYEEEPDRIDDEA